MVRVSIIITSLMLLIIFNLVAAPLMVDVENQMKLSDQLQSFEQRMNEVRAIGLDQGTRFIRPISKQFNTQSIGDIEPIVVLVDFSDKPAQKDQHSTSYFDNMLFSQNSFSSGSMSDYYKEVSYNKYLFNKGFVTNWIRAPQNYRYYNNNDMGVHGTYPNNVQKLVEDALIIADPDIDYSLYDNDGPDGFPNSGDDDGFVDGIIVVHSGHAAEETGSNGDFISHQWFLYDELMLDGVTLYYYTIQAEYSLTGTFCHEFGHILGLPDLYNVKGGGKSNVVVGVWDLMDRGIYGGPEGKGSVPSHFSIWSKYYLGWVDPVNLTECAGDYKLATISSQPVGLRLWTNGTKHSEYFLVENRRKVGFDRYLPGEGLMVYHIDTTVANVASGDINSGFPKYVQPLLADGILTTAKPWGDAWDVFHSGTRNKLGADTTLSNKNERTWVELCNISGPGDIMTMDVQINQDCIFDTCGPSDVMELIFYPNPISIERRDKVKIINCPIKTSNIEVYDIAGQLIKKQNHPIGESNSEIALNGLDDHPIGPGLYVIILRDKDGREIWSKALAVVP